MSITHIPFYPSDWISGTNSMTAEERGVYISLLSYMYEAAGPIDRNDARLFRMCGCKSKRAFQKCLSYLIDEGKVTEVNGELFNEKTQKTIEKVIEKSEKAKAAAESKWGRKCSKNNDPLDADASQTHMQNGCQPKPKPKPNITSLREDGKAGSGGKIKDIWKDGLDTLIAMGLSRTKAKGLLGKWVKSSGKDKIGEAIESALGADTGDPVAYITAILSPKNPLTTEEMLKDRENRPRMEQPKWN